MEYEQARFEIVTRREALKEIREHNADVDEFVEEFGDLPEYDGQDVLDFLGY